MKVWGTTDKILRQYLTGFANIALEFVEIEDLEHDLRKKQDPFIDEILDALNESIGRYDYVRYRQIQYRIGLYGLWGAFQDDAYTDFARDLIINVAERLQKKKYLMKRKDPADWHINKWWGKQK